MAKAAAPSSDLLFRVRWYIYVRWFLLLGVIMPTLITLYLGEGMDNSRLLGDVMAASLLLANGIFFILSRFKLGHVYYKTLGVALLAFDVLFITLLIHTGGAIESRMLLLYAVPILMAAPMFGRAGVYWTAASAAVAYDALILLNFWGVVRSPNTLTHLSSNGNYVAYSLTIFSTALLMVGVAADFLTRLLIQKEREATAAVEALNRAQTVAHLGSWEWDVQDDRITWSEELYRLYGATPTQPLNLDHYLQYIHPDDRPQVADAIAKALKTHRPFNFDHRIIMPNKVVRVVHGEGKVVTNRHGRAVQMYGIAQDMTAERALESAKGDFVALASHQLRTPASGVRMLLAMLRDGYVDALTPAQLQMVEEAYDANERLLRISDDLLNVAKLEAGRLVLNRQQMELRHWLKTVIAPQKLLARQNRQRLRLEVPKGVWYLHGDQERLAMVLDNLLSNARKYTPPRGLIQVTLAPNARTYKLVVADTGSGMSRLEVANLFGKFTRLDNPASRGAEGTGLGLYLAKSIVDLHQGSIKVSSKPGVGSTFTITLPRR